MVAHTLKTGTSSYGAGIASTRYMVEVMPIIEQVSALVRPRVPLFFGRLPHFLEFLLDAKRVLQSESYKNNFKKNKKYVELQHSVIFVILLVT